MYSIALLFLRLFPRLIKSDTDTSQVKVIVKCKLLMDNRKVINSNSSSKEPNYSLLFQLLLYGAFGVVAAIFIGLGTSAYWSLFFTYAYLIVMLCMNLIIDFNTVILDTRDNTIILPRPVSESTQLTAKILHISSYVIGFAISYSIVPFIVIIIKFNLVATLVFLINILLCVIFTLFLANTLYFGLMKIVSGEKFKDIISYFQIAITIFLFGGYQVLIRSIDIFKNVKWNTGEWWLMLLPPSWMASGNQSFIDFNFTWVSILSLILSIIVPFTGLWFVVKYLAPGLNNKMAVLEQGELKKVKEGKERFSLSGILSKIFTRSQEEAVFFRIIWKIAGRDRKFKQTMYPLVGSVIVFFFMIYYNNFSGFADYYKSKAYLLLLYFPLFYLFIICINIKYSDNFKSAWIYKAIPLNSPGEIVSASIKAISVKLFIPVYLLCNGVLLFYTEIEYSFEILTALMINFICLIGTLSLFKFDLPFTASNSNKSTNGNMMLSILLLPLGAAMAGIHYLLIRFNANFMVIAFVLMIFCWYMFRMVRKAGWKKIEPFEI